MFCYWPRTNISFRARKAEIPDKEKWAKYPVRILHYTGEHYRSENTFIFMVGGKLSVNMFLDKWLQI
jgi:molybdopterin synthase catalytic subunit